MGEDSRIGILTKYADAKARVKYLRIRGWCLMLSLAEKSGASR